MQFVNLDQQSVGATLEEEFLAENLPGNMSTEYLVQD